MRLTIIKEDNGVYVDGEFLSVDCSELPSNFHALQWNGLSGHIEFVNNIKPPEPISDVTPYQIYIDRWNIAKEERLQYLAKIRAEL